MLTLADGRNVRFKEIIRFYFFVIKWISSLSNLLNYYYEYQLKRADMNNDNIIFQSI